MEYYKGTEAPWEAFKVDEATWRDPSWQLKHSIRDPNELSLYVDLDQTQVKMISHAMKKGKPMRIPPYYVALMGKNPTGVIGGKSVSDDVSGTFRQAVPTPAYYLFKAGVPDPMSEGKRSVGKAYQRYVDRVALMSSPSGICHMYCGFCQRGKDMKKVDGDKHFVELEDGMAYITENRNIKEVLVTGGDALALSESNLIYILDRLSKIGHVESVRISSRLPVTHPYAVTDDKLEMISEYSRNGKGGKGSPNIYVVTHANSPEELTEDMQDAVTRMRRNGFDVRNQAVLLKGVNDDFGKLSRLYSGLHHMGVNPRYMFQCHKVEGLASDIVPINVGQALVSELRGQEGSSIPVYAVNMVGGGGKTVITPSGDNGIQDFEYNLSKNMRTWDNRVVEYEELLRVSESGYEKGMQAMSRFYGDESIRDYAEKDEGEFKVRETSSGKFRPSVIVVDDNDPENVLYVTNVKAPDVMERDEKLDKMGFYRNGPELGFSSESYVTDPSGFTPQFLLLGESDTYIGQ